MPIAPTQIANREEFSSVVADESHLLHLKDNFLEKSYFSENAEGEIIVRAGLILAQETNTKKYTPYSATVSYGPGSDTAVGVLQDPQNATYEEPVVAPIVHGKLIEAHAYVYGATTKGSIPDAVKTDLDDIHWV